MPNLKSFTFKYRLTAIEGSRIRKATTVLLNNEGKKKKSLKTRIFNLNFLQQRKLQIQKGF